jgi:hypothetical protein
LIHLELARRHGQAAAAVESGAQGRVGLHAPGCENLASAEPRS